MAPRFETGVETARLAGDYLRSQFRTRHSHTYKSPGDPVSEIDHNAERLIVEHLQSTYPNDAVLSEERGAIGDGSKRWIVDPLDGTSNYLRGIPDFAISIAFEVDDEPRFGIVYRPASDDMYAAARTAEFDAGVSLGVSDTESLDRALVSIPYASAQSDRDAVWETHRVLGSNVEGLRSSGSGALDLAYVASGITDATCGFNQSEWDRSAGLFLVEAVGGRVTNHRGQECANGDFVASNGRVHDELLDAVPE